MDTKHKKVVLVTGASSGIGQATARAFVRRGWVAYGTSRSIAAGAVHLEDGVHMIRLDVTDEDSAREAVALVLAREGRLDALVNNAGSGIAGALEDTTLAEAMAQFDTIVWGTLRMCRAALPALRESRGIIVGVSSVAALVSIPYQALYSAGKAAMESMSEALRMEVAPQDVRVCVVEPGDTATGFTSARRIVDGVSPLYAERLSASVARMANDEQRGAPPERVARVICRMAEHRRPPMRRAVGAGYKLLAWLSRLLPDGLRLFILSRMYG